MNPSRLGAAVGAAERAGTIASRNGSAIVAPRPRRNVRRGSAIFVTIMSEVSKLSRAGGRIYRRPRRRRSPHVEWRALDDAQDQRRETVVVALGTAQDSTDRRRIVVLEAAANRIRQ